LSPFPVSLVEVLPFLLGNYYADKIIYTDHCMELIYSETYTWEA